MNATIAATIDGTGSAALDDRGGGWIGMAICAIVSILLCGLVYPGLATWLSGALFPAQSMGSLIERDGRVVGSALVAQPFVSERYFQSRPSAANYDVFALAGSNWAPSNPALRERVATASAAIAMREGIAAASLPVDLVTASGSGIDPHISPDAARVQAQRVARARGMPAADVIALIDAQVEGPVFGLLGQPRVNVLRLNLALDERAMGPSLR
jgi:K+-transporting ATPase ATPase C chain